MAHVVLLSLFFPPDGVSTAHLVGELAVDLSKAGHTVEVVTTTPHRERDRDAERNQPIRRPALSPFGKSSFGDIPVHHILMPRKSPRTTVRLAQWAWFHLWGTLVGLFPNRQPDVILAFSPPLTVGLNAWFIGRFGRIPYTYTVQELYPDVAVQLGYVSNPRIIGLLRRLEKFVYRKAAAVTVICPEMASVLTVENRAPKDKIHVIQNFVDTELFAPQPRVNGFRGSHTLGDEFLVSYAGNMGPAQRLGALLSVAHRLRARRDLHFLLVGGGTERPNLESRAASLDLNNCTILEHQPYSLMPEIYGASDVCAVPLDSHVSCEALPSKVYKIMSSGRPVLALTPNDSALGQLVGRAECGLVAEPGSIDGIADAVTTLADDPERARAFGAAGRSWVEQNASRHAVVARYLSLIDSISSNGRLENGAGGSR